MLGVDAVVQDTPGDGAEPPWALGPHGVGQGTLFSKKRADAGLGPCWFGWGMRGHLAAPQTWVVPSVGAGRGGEVALSAPFHRSYLDMAKVVMFRYLFWFVLVVVFITGATRISLFGLGYLLACFYLLLFGTAMLRKPVRARLVLWDCLILYNITVIISKNMLSVRDAGPWP